MFIWTCACGFVSSVPDQKREHQARCDRRVAEGGRLQAVVLESGSGELMDLTPFVKELHTGERPWPQEQTDRGLMFHRDAFALVMDFRETCPLCGLKFRRATETPQPFVSIDGGPYVPACDACAVEHLIEE